MIDFKPACAGLLLGFLASGGVNAGTASLQALVDGDSLTAGSVIFTDWGFIDPPPFATDMDFEPEPANIMVTSSVSGPDDVMLTFDMGSEMYVDGSLGGFSFVDMYVGFAVSTSDPSQVLYDNGLEITDATADGDPTFGAPYVYIYEYVYLDKSDLDPDAPADNAIASKVACLDPYVDPPAGCDTTDSAAYPPGSKQVFVTKNIALAATDIDDVAQLNQFTQTFSLASVPEPSSVLLFGLGLVVAGVARYKKSQAG